jgi:hypothetical protein
VSSYSSSSPTYAYGGDFVTWVSPAASMEIGSDNLLGWARFTGLTAVLAAGTTIGSATLTLNFPAPGTDEQLAVAIETAANAALPADQADSSGRFTSAPQTSGSVNGLSTFPFDVKTNIQSFVDGLIGGDVLHFIVTNPSYHGTGLTGATGSLAIMWEPSGGPLPAIFRQKIVNINQAVNRAAIY